MHSQRKGCEGLPSNTLKGYPRTLLGPFLAPYCLWCTLPFLSSFLFLFWGHLFPLECHKYEYSFNHKPNLKKHLCSVQILSIPAIYTYFGANYRITCYTSIYSWISSELRKIDAPSLHYILLWWNQTAPELAKIIMKIKQIEK